MGGCALQRLAASQHATIALPIRGAEPRLNRVELLKGTRPWEATVSDSDGQCSPVAGSKCVAAPAGIKQPTRLSFLALGTECETVGFPDKDNRGGYIGRQCAIGIF